MITVTRFDGTTLIVNVDLIEFIESRPDTVLSLTTGKKVIVLESLGDILDAVVKYKQRILRGPIVMEEPTEEGK
jgi:flagellar protein FlbD